MDFSQIAWTTFSFGAFLVLAFIVLYFLAGIIPYLPIIKFGLGLFVLQDGVDKTLREIKSHLLQCRKESLDKREKLSALMEETPPASGQRIEDAHSDFYWADKAVRLNEFRLYRAIAIALLLGKVDIARRYME